METEHSIVQQVYASKGDMQAADRFISAYMPFIKAETAKFLNRPPIEGHDDEFSIAMIAFHEAIQGYSRKRGSFLNYASLLIKNRLIDYWRKNKRHSGNLSIDAAREDDDTPLSETLTDDENPNETLHTRQATREEIEELSNQMREFGVTLTDVAENSPKQQRTLHTCKKALQYVKEQPNLMELFLRTRRLPITKIAKGANVEKKTLERHRKYLVTLLLIYSNGYEIIRGHLHQVLKRENAE